MTQPTAANRNASKANISSSQKQLAQTPIHNRTNHRNPSQGIGWTSCCRINAPVAIRHEASDGNNTRSAPEAKAQIHKDVFRWLTFPSIMVARKYIRIMEITLVPCAYLG